MRARVGRGPAGAQPRGEVAGATDRLSGSAEKGLLSWLYSDVFEEYVRRCFLRSLGRAFHVNPEYAPERLPLVDGALVLPRSLGLPECKAGRLILAVREIGNEADLERSVETGLDRAARQLAAAIAAGQAGEIHGIETGPETPYYPIIVTYEPLPSHPSRSKSTSGSSTAMGDCEASGSSL